jgi:alpha/beta superfamily hydrolase
LFVQGSNDEHGAIEKVKALIPTLPGDNHLVVVEGVAHFFAGKLDQLGRAINAWLTDEVFRLRH